MITIDTIMGRYKECQRYNLNQDTKKYFRYIDEEMFYISPSFSEIKIDSKLAASKTKIILFSAPGAMGKSSLARYIAHRYQGIYWDSAKMRLGTNSFSGTVIKSVSSQYYSSFIHDLNDAKAILVVDALDEAEIISGSEMVLDFIDEINETLGEKVNDAPASIFLLTRTETAHSIISHCIKTGIHLVHYQIDFFEERDAKKFIIEKTGMRDHRIIQECTDGYYTIISDKIGEENVRSFLGYAPVLEAIAKHIATFQNPKQLLNELESTTDSVHIIIQILEDLLLREQNEKVIPALSAKVKEIDYTGRNIYTPCEQLVRLIYYILFDDAKYENTKVADLRKEHIEKYQEILDLYLNQHPFVYNDMTLGDSGNVRFAGPAFRDYALAKLLVSTNSETRDAVNGYMNEFSHAKEYSPSQIFFDCYMEMSKKNVRATDVEWLFDAFRAKTSAYQTPIMHIVEDEMFESKDDEGYQKCDITFILEDVKEKKTVESRALMEIPEKEIRFRNLHNCYVDLPSSSVVVGESSSTSIFSNSSVIAKRIVWRASEIKIKVYQPHRLNIVSYEDMKKTSSNFSVEGDGKILVDVPNINLFYRLIPYQGNFDKISETNIDGFAHVVYTILREFRSHRKDTLAKDAEKINNIVVGGSSDKGSVLKYLIQRKVIYLDAHLYKINMEIMKRMGLNNIIIHRKDINMQNLHQDFLRWKELENI